MKHFFTPEAPLNAFDPILRAVQGSMRPDPAADDAAYEVAKFQRQCARDAAFRESLDDEQIEPEYERDAAEFFAAEQCPSDSTFR